MKKILYLLLIILCIIPFTACSNDSNETEKTKKETVLNLEENIIAQGYNKASKTSGGTINYYYYLTFGLKTDINNFKIEITLKNDALILAVDNKNNTDLKFWTPDSIYPYESKFGNYRYTIEYSLDDYPNLNWLKVTKITAIIYE